MRRCQQPQEPLTQRARRLTPDQFHLAMRHHPYGDLGRPVRWYLVAHAKRYHPRHHTTGHVWQVRYNAFPVQDDDHAVGVPRYVKSNASRAELVARAEDWKWSSVPGSLGRDALLWRGVVPVRDSRWLERVNEPLSSGDLGPLRLSVERGRPYGDDSWTKATAHRLGLESTLRSRGQPRKQEE